MLRLRPSKWAKIIDWLKAKRDKRLIDGQAKEDDLAHAQAHGQDKYVEEQIETFQRFLYRFLVDYTKEQARMNILAREPRHRLSSLMFRPLCRMPL